MRTEEKSAADEVEADSTADGKQLARTDEGGRKGRPSRKEKATRTRRDAEQDRAAATKERTTPAAFVRESTTELRKVVWPTGTQVQQYFVVVLVFVLFIIAFVSLLDLGFGWLVLKAFG
ncbi:preprotein translocase subunit SecE [Enemella evansiae]|uniref:Protein translocase subunit SecE n=1 Tax=Enemella evansiae TaxID=2016499 RepID=A0A255GCQ8_9ACTN|nr:preprotein translocase subunit SecE [Enemella evansiae]OYO01749.1 preprotein translocase subunit SecE [Enemella evansiae]OYO04294.1 preprotein translocase subunit SecE [Enemella evansiae]OYO10203.1 preprotein translocase subunit SecE [Enemella evansiae]OYO13667.1 preprotein translocase subunit SecE [Enemella evansiae]